MRSSSTTLRRRTLVVTGLLVAACVVAAVVWAVVTAATTADRRSIGDLFAVTATAPAVPPEELDTSELGVGGLDHSALHELGVFGGHALYLASDSDGNVCLVVFDPAAGSSSASCSPPEALAGYPLTVGLRASDGRGVEAYLLPDGYQIVHLPPTWTRVSDNVIALDTSSARGERVQVLNLPGEELSFG